jgi:hypothetical protein
MVEVPELPECDLCSPGNQHTRRSHQFVQPVDAVHERVYVISRGRFGHCLWRDGYQVLVLMVREGPEISVEKDTILTDLEDLHLTGEDQVTLLDLSQLKSTRFGALVVGDGAA